MFLSRAGDSVLLKYSKDGIQFSIVHIQRLILGIEMFGKLHLVGFGPLY